MPSLQPAFLWKMFYASIKTAMHYLFTVILTTILILWVIWKILKSIPLIGPIILKFTPWPELDGQTGVLPFVDSSVSLIFSGWPFRDRMQNLGYSFINFAKGSTVFLIDSIGNAFGVPDDIRFNMKLTMSGVPTLPVVKPPTEEEDVPTNTPDALLEQQEQMQLDDEYNLCIQENIIPENPKLSGLNRITARVKNSMVSTKCKYKNLRSIQRNIIFKS